MSADVDRLAGQLLPDKARPIAVYCTNVACSNSHTVAAKLRRLGYADVRTYRGGLEDWVQAGLPVESGDAPAPPTG